MNNRIDTQEGVKQLKENSNWYLLLGIGLIILGILAITFALKSTLFSITYLGIFVMLIGLFEIIHSFQITKWSNFFLHIILGVFYTIGGLFVVFNPIPSALSLTLLLAILLVASGISKIVFSLFRRNVPYNGWLFANGVLSFILGVLIWYQWPYSGLWILGTFLGIDMIFTGWTWVFLSLKVKNLRIEE